MNAQLENRQRDFGGKLQNQFNLIFGSLYNSKTYSSLFLRSLIKDGALPNYEMQLPEFNLVSIEKK